MAGQRPKGLKLLKAALATRKSATMLAFGFSSGLPFALLIGTLNAWLGDAKVNLATIGVLSWIGLSYAFKFLWSPLVDRVRIPVLGRRTSWIVLCQVGLIIAFIGLGATDPATNIGWFAIFAVIGAFSSATQDIAVDAWRIDVADERQPLSCSRPSISSDTVPHRSSAEPSRCFLPRGSLGAPSIGSWLRSSSS